MDQYPDGARRVTVPGFFGQDRQQDLDTSWLYETPPSGYSAPAVPVQQPVTVPADVVARRVEPADFEQPGQRVQWAGMPGRVSTARWSLGRTLAATVPAVLVLATLSMVGVFWLFGIVTWWATVPAVAGGLIWVGIAAVDAGRYALRGGAPPPIL